MPIFHPDTISTDSLKIQTNEKIGKYLGRHLCSILDWGKRTNSPYKHFIELKKTLEGFTIDRKNEFYLCMLNQCTKYLATLKNATT